jgi:hypothetical protein
MGDNTNRSKLNNEMRKKDGINVLLLDDIISNLDKNIKELNNKSAAKADIDLLSLTINEINSNINEMKHTLKASMGTYGGAYSGAATITPADGYIFVAVRVLTDAVLTCNGNMSGITAIAFDANTTFEGRFTEIEITSGTIMAYQGIDEE